MRTLFSLDGGRTLTPFEKPIDSAVDPLQAYIAVRYVGYWTEGFVFLVWFGRSGIDKSRCGVKGCHRRNNRRH